METGPRFIISDWRSPGSNLRSLVYKASDLTNASQRFLNDFVCLNLSTGIKMADTTCLQLLPSQLFLQFDMMFFLFVQDMLSISSLFFLLIHVVSANRNTIIFAYYFDQTRSTYK